MLHIQTSDPPDVAKAALAEAGYEVTELEGQEETPGSEGAAETTGGEAGNKTAAADGKPAEGGKDGGSSADASKGAEASGAEDRERNRVPGSKREKLKNQRLQAQVDELQAKVAELTAGAAAPAKTETAAAQPKPRPKRADFLNAEDPDAAYDQAFSDWILAEADRKSHEREVKTASEKKQAEQTESAKARGKRWQEQQEEARERFEDYDDVVANPEALLSTAMASVILSVEDSAGLAYELAKHHIEESERIFLATDLPETATEAQRAVAERRARREMEKLLPTFFKKAGDRTTDAAGKAGEKAAATDRNGTGKQAGAETRQAETPGKSKAKPAAPPPATVGASSSGVSGAAIDYDKMASGDSPVSDFMKAHPRRRF